MPWNVQDRVRHPAMREWGVGEVIEVLRDAKLRVCFEYGGEKLLKDAPLTEAVGADTTRPLPRCAKTTRKGAARRSIHEYKEVFLERFPRGFADPGYLSDERDYKVKAKQLLADSLPVTSFEPLMSAGDDDEACRLALAVVNATNLVFPNEKMALRNGLKSAKARRQFSAALFALLYGKGEFAERFTTFADVLTEIGAAKWTIATYFPFLATPDTHMFLKPEVTKRIAVACGVELNYRPELNALTYQSLQRLSEHLLEFLKDLEPRDLIDVQSFIWCAAR